MFDKHTVIFRILPSILIFSFFALLLLRANDGVGDGIPIGRICVGWGWEDRDVSDVVFVGTSRSFRAIDTFDLTERLSTSQHQYKDADLIWTLGPQMAPKISSFLSLIDGNKPVPQVLIIENSFRQRGVKLDRIPLTSELTLSKGHRRYMRADHLSFLTEKIDQKYDRKFRSKFSADYLSKYDQVSMKISSIFYDFLSKPSLIFNPRKKACFHEFKKWNMRYNPNRYKSNTKTVKKDERHQRLLKQVENYAKLDPHHLRRRHEVNLTNILIETAKKRGVKKVYVWIISDYSLNYIKDDEKALREVYPLADDVVFGEITDALIETGKDRRELFRDANHVNKTSRKVITDYWYNYLLDSQN